jgi:hypothetical protein
MIRKAILKQEVIDKINKLIQDVEIIEDKKSFTIDINIDFGEPFNIYVEGKIESDFVNSGGLDTPPEVSVSFEVEVTLMQLFNADGTEWVDFDVTEWGDKGGF